jgi:hypothetical protein
LVWLLAFRGQKSKPKAKPNTPLLLKLNGKPRVQSATSIFLFQPSDPASRAMTPLSIDEHAAQSPAARHANRFFGPAQARPGPAGCVPGPAQTIQPDRAWAAGYACRAARPDPPKNGRHGPARCRGAASGSGQRGISPFSRCAAGPTPTRPLSAPSLRCPLARLSPSRGLARLSPSTSPSLLAPPAAHRLTVGRRRSLCWIRSVRRRSPGSGSASVKSLTLNPKSLTLNP